MENNSKRITLAPAPPPGTLSRSEIFSLGIGQCIGSGILTAVGAAMALTGNSAWVCYIIAVVLGFFKILPYSIVCGTVRLAGGDYSIVGGLTNPTMAGMFAVSSFSDMLLLGSYTVAFGLYANTLFPNIPGKYLGFAALLIFLIFNLFGTNVMAKFQKYMVRILIVAMLVLVVFGVTKIQNPIFDFSDPMFMTGGTKGFLSAVQVMMFSTTGYFCVVNYSAKAKNPRKDIPPAFLICLPMIFIIYVGIAIVTTGSVPFEQASGGALTVVAKTVFNNDILFALFMVCGPFLAICTSMNSSLANSTIPVATAAEDGWFPKVIAKRNKYGAPWILLLVTFLFGAVPVLFDASITAVVSNINLFTSARAFLITYGILQLPKKYPEAWAKSSMHMPMWLFYLIVGFSGVIYAVLFVVSCMTLTTANVIASLVACVLCVLYGYFRSRDPKINIRVSMWEIEDEEEAKA